MPKQQNKPTQAIEILKKFWTGEEFAIFNKFDPWRILVSGIISHRTNDNVTFPATERIMEKWPTAFDLAKASPDEVASTIFPAGFYNKKGIRLVEIAKEIVDLGNVPKTIDELLKIKGIGRKTANLILSLGFQIPSIVVDTHVHRISNRTGWVKTSTPEETEYELMSLLPKNLWTISNELLVRLGQNICRPIRPLCSKCPIKNPCKVVLGQAGFVVDI